ncbi:MAG TPA: CHC2 zinc finger domain-containing protein, partial [Acidobacteriaceae bacterium]
MPGIDFRAARARLPLAAVLELLGFVPHTRVGHQLRGACPVHRSRSRTSRSFAAPLGKQAWHCFRCGAGGNALDLGAALTRQDLHATVLDLCQRLGRDVPWLPRSPARPARPRADIHAMET